MNARTYTKIFFNMQVFYLISLFYICSVQNERVTILIAYLD